MILLILAALALLIFSLTLGLIVYGLLSSCDHKWCSSSLRYRTCTKCGLKQESVAKYYWIDYCEEKETTTKNN